MNGEGVIMNPLSTDPTIHDENEKSHSGI